MPKGKSRIYKVTIARKGKKSAKVGSITAKNKTAAQQKFKKNLKFTRDKKAEKLSARAARATPMTQL